MRKPLRELRFEEFPERQKGQEIGALVAKQEVRFVGRLLLRERPLARIGDRQRACDHEHFREASGIAPGENHSSNPRIDRQARELAPERRQRALFINGGKLLELLIAVGNRARRGRLDERERVDRS